MQHLDSSSANLDVGQGAGLGDGGVVALQRLHCPLHQPRPPAPAGQPHVHRVLPLQCGYQRVMQWSFNRELLSQEKPLHRDCAAAVPFTPPPVCIGSGKLASVTASNAKNWSAQFPQIFDLQQRLGTWM